MLCGSAEKAIQERVFSLVVGIVDVAYKLFRGGMHGGGGGGGGALRKVDLLLTQLDWHWMLIKTHYLSPQ